MSFGLRSVPGWVRSQRGRNVLYARVDMAAEVVRCGLDDPERWEELLAQGRAGAGRGATARIELRGAGGVVLKKMRRGGLAAGLWRDRFAGTRRILAHLDVTLEVARRGIATPAVVAVLVRPRGAGLFEAWVATECVEGGRDLLTLLREGAAAADAAGAAMGLVRRMHDAGVHHRDLHLGNLLLRPIDARGWEAWILDLDRTRLRSGPLPYRLRRKALRRLERSYLKWFGAAGPLGAGSGPAWYERYAEGNADLARHLRSGRRAAKLAVALHRLGWRRR